MQRLPDIRAVDGGEARGHDTDDGVGVLVDMDDLAENVGVRVERTPPEIFAEQNGGRRVRQVFVAGEGVAEDRRDAERRQVGGGHA